MDQQYCPAVIEDGRAIQEPRANGVLLQVEKGTPARQAIPWHRQDRREDENLVRSVHPRTD